jgi:bifunctional N-acetylglucosamine-1-phosphate-uridyltransferase/glucosamine-1-phosphate-acetyltransferase GlmU-like protein
MSIYPGNSGGPVIENDKLVGIILGQPMEERKSQPHEAVNIEFKIDIPVSFGRIIKAEYVWELLKIQEEKDRS